jgi:hypothetical protein
LHSSGCRRRGRFVHSARRRIRSLVSEE